MKYIKTLVGAFVALALLVTVASAAPSTNTPIAQTSSDLGPWTFSVSGGGSSALSGAKVSSSSIGGEFEIGHSAKIILPAEVGVRQSIGYSDANGSGWDYSTRLFTDVTVIRLGNLEADAGVNAGLSYGNGSEVWTAAPELTGRVYLKKDVDLFARVEYPFNLTQGESENTLRYSIGLRVRF